MSTKDVCPLPNCEAVARNGCLDKNGISPMTDEATLTSSQQWVCGNKDVISW